MKEITNYKFEEIEPVLSKKRCFIFDMDNTLINLNADWTGIKKGMEDLALKIYNQKISFRPLWKGCKFITKNYGDDALKPFLKYLEEHENYAALNYAEPNEHGMEVFLRIYNTFIRSPYFNENNISVSENGKNGGNGKKHSKDENSAGDAMNSETCCCAIVSNNFCSTIDILLERFKISGMFRKRIGRDSVKKMKPHPEGISKIFETLKGVNKEQLIFFGDSEYDKKAASKFGIDFFYIDQIEL